MVPLVALLCFSLVMMGALVWIDNSWALITDNDPATMTRLDLLQGGGLDSLTCQALDQDGDGVIPFPGGYLIRGNGGLDDNKEEPFIVEGFSGIIIKPQPFKAVTNFRDRRTVVAYKDFGHLKLMPLAEAIYVYNLTFYKSKATRVLRAAFGFSPDDEGTLFGEDKFLDTLEERAATLKNFDGSQTANHRTGKTSSGQGGLTAACVGVKILRKKMD